MMMWFGAQMRERRTKIRRLRSSKIVINKDKLYLQMFNTIGTGFFMI